MSCFQELGGASARVTHLNMWEWNARILCLGVLPSRRLVQPALDMLFTVSGLLLRRNRVLHLLVTPGFPVLQSTELFLPIHRV